ncbi:glucokinase [Rhodoferax koreense]|uniref:Glucokinase n=1 Tax=Rhodoferax koreensis TaxID=1842727 RepID=A0A1P8K1V4_9BURK|nr:ROK family protein [Rhodoferax koreense]APW39988.1 glucokinase [Rhodoferax koreense]
MPAQPPAPAFHADIHGSPALPAVTIDSYSLEVRESDGQHFVGDRASRTAFCGLLDGWRRQFKSMHGGDDPLGDLPSGELGKKRLDALLDEKGDAAEIIRVAIEDFAHQLAHVAGVFLKQKKWQGVQRIIVGGGFQQSQLGELAVARAAELLRQEKIRIDIRRLHHHADEGGLIGWVHIVPANVLRGFDALLAVDIGGTNARCGIVRPNRDKAADLSQADVVERVKWSHARDEDATHRVHVIDGIAEMLEKLATYAKRKEIRLAPFVGVSCPGVVQKDGAIAAGTQNLPGDWESPHFHLPTALRDKFPTIHGEETRVLLHNDAVVQGLSELPFTADVKRWGVLTVGTGLGNASYTNR